MNNEFLYKKTDSLEQAKASAIVPLKDRIKQLKARLKNNVLIDISGSMDEYVGERTKHEIVQETIDKIPKEVKKFAFNSNFIEMDNILPRPAGGTGMGMAFEEIKKRDIKEIILITDGIPDSESHALRAAEGLLINIIYIGPQPKPAFLDRLAKQTNGNYVDIDMLKLGDSLGMFELENKIKGFLT